MTADQVANDCCHNKSQDPPATPDTKIIQRKYQQEQIEAIPEFLLPQKRHDPVEKRECPGLIDFMEQPAVELQKGMGQDTGVKT